MRITNASMVRSHLYDTQNNLTNMSKINQQISTGKVINTVSDDPHKAIKIMNINNEIKYTTIENGEPLGICGSGIVDLLSEMFLNGWVDFSGELKENASKHIIKVDNELAVEYASKDESKNQKS